MLGWYFTNSKNSTEIWSNKKPSLRTGILAHDNNFGLGKGLGAQKNRLK